MCSHFCDYKFWHALWDISAFYLFLQKSRLLSPNNISFKEAMATKNVVSQATIKNTGSLSGRSCQTDTIPKRQVHGMYYRDLCHHFMPLFTQVLVRLII